MKRKARARITTMREAAQLNSRVEVILGSMCAKTRITMKLASTFAKCDVCSNSKIKIVMMPATTKEAKFFQSFNCFYHNCKVSRSK